METLSKKYDHIEDGILFTALQETNLKSRSDNDLSRTDQTAGITSSKAGCGHKL